MFICCFMHLQKVHFYYSARFNSSVISVERIISDDATESDPDCSLHDCIIGVYSSSFFMLTLQYLITVRISALMRKW